MTNETIELKIKNNNYNLELLLIDEIIIDTLINTILIDINYLILKRNIEVWIV